MKSHGRFAMGAAHLLVAAVDTRLVSSSSLVRAITEVGASMSKDCHHLGRVEVGCSGAPRGSEGRGIARRPDRPVEVE